MAKKYPLLTVDAVILSKNRLEVVLIKRKNGPFKGMWALPGGFVEYGEKVEEATVREAKEETSLEVKIERLFGVYSAPGRDPRGHSISVCFLCQVVRGKMKAGTDAQDAKWFKFSNLPKSAFDHGKILGDVKEREIKL